MEILDEWVENGFINLNQREAMANLLAETREDAYAAADNYDDGYDAGWDEGYSAAKAELEEKMKDVWFQQGWEEALIEHGIEE